MHPRSLLPVGLTLALALPLLAGCSKVGNNPVAPLGGPGGSSLDQAQVSSAMAGTPQLIEDALFETPDQTLLAAGGPVGAAALIHPLRYWRHITSVRRTFEFAFSDTDSTGRPTQALVTIRKYMRGTFNLLYDATPDDSTAFDSVAALRKPLADLWERHVLLKRVRWDGAGEAEWKVAGISGVQVTSFKPDGGLPPIFGDTRIVKLRIQSASGDVTISDPLALHMLRRIPTFDPGENLTVTATTLRNDDIVVLQRMGERRRFHNNGDNTYTIFVHAAPERGVRHLGVNALSNGTLFDDAKPYDSQAWLLPYHIAPDMIADFMP